jgi:hypothetical protein
LRDTGLDGAESKDLEDAYLPMPFGAFQTPKPAPGGPVTVFPGAENKNCEHLAMSGSYIYILAVIQARSKTLHRPGD